MEYWKDGKLHGNGDISMKINKKKTWTESQKLILGVGNLPDKF